MKKVSGNLGTYTWPLFGDDVEKVVLEVSLDDNLVVVGDGGPAREFLPEELQSNFQVNPYSTVPHGISEVRHPTLLFTNPKSLLPNVLSPCTTVTAFLFPLGAMERVTLISTSLSFFLALTMPLPVQRTCRACSPPVTSCTPRSRGSVYSQYLKAMLHLVQYSTLSGYITLGPGPEEASLGGHRPGAAATAEIS